MCYSGELIRDAVSKIDFVCFGVKAFGGKRKETVVLNIYFLLLLLLIIVFCLKLQNLQEIDEKFSQNVLIERRIETGEPEGVR